MATNRGRLLWRDVGGERDYVAAYITAQPAVVEHTSLHSHDFHEVMLVVEGRGLHYVNGVEVLLRPRDLVLVRPHDTHAIATQGGRGLQFINVAWRTGAWREFAAYAGFRERMHEWDAAAGPAAVRIPPERFAHCRRGFDEVLAAFHAGETGARAETPLSGRLKLAAFWALVVSLLTGSGQLGEDGLLPQTDGGAQPWPNWLRQACQAMRGDNLQQGLPRFVELAGVTPEHLARTLRRCSGRTPTEWLTERRLQQAALLLTTTPNAVSDIALDCGFSNGSYFHKLFRRRFGHSPRSYRLRAQRLVDPGSGG